jgi:Na+-driven multidrug efflux pump
MGVVGAALATSIGRTSGVLYQLYRLTRGDGRLTVRMRHVRLEASTMLSVLRLSGAGTLQTVVGMTSWILLVRIISRFGSQAVAGYTIAIRLVIFALLPSFGLANAAATLVGQNLGAKKPERAERAAWTAGHLSAVFLGTVGLLFIAAAPHIVGIFTTDPVVLAHGVHGLRIISAGFAFYGYGMTFTQSLNGAGATWAPTWLNGLCFWAFELPLAWVLAVHAGLETTGAFIACLAAFSLLAVASGAVFRRGRWKTVAV